MENAKGRKTLSRNQLGREKPLNLALPAYLHPGKVLSDAELYTKSDQAANMAAFNVIKKSLETMEQNVSQCKIMLESRVKSLNEMKRKQSEAETDEERRELKIAIDSLEHIIATDKSALSDMDTACKNLREEFDKAEEEAVDQDLEEDRLSIVDQDSETGEKRKTFTKEELEAEITRRGVASLSFKFDRLCSALAEGRREGGMESGEERFSRGPSMALERKRILGTLPSFVTGTTDFQLHIEAF